MIFEIILLALWRIFKQLSIVVQARKQDPILRELYNTDLWVICFVF